MAAPEGRVPETSLFISKLYAGGGIGAGAQYSVFVLSFAPADIRSRCWRIQMARQTATISTRTAITIQAMRVPVEPEQLSQYT